MVGRIVLLHIPLLCLLPVTIELLSKKLIDAAQLLSTPSADSMKAFPHMKSLFVSHKKVIYR